MSLPEFCRMVLGVGSGKKKPVLWGRSPHILFQESVTAVPPNWKEARARGGIPGNVRLLAQTSKHKVNGKLGS